ncbi:hypothetical protein HN588_12535 [Candidatus Bathyarchaeota archaeon]|nr:hypothetical protein [Candidatus Bathyarchaeota archaeon]
MKIKAILQNISDAFTSIPQTPGFQAVCPVHMIPGISVSMGKSYQALVTTPIQPDSAIRRDQAAILSMYRGKSGNPFHSE